MHVDLLKSLNGIEARILRVIFAWFDDGDFGDSASTRRWKTAMKRWPKLNSEELRICLQNLQRLGLLTPNIAEMEILEHNTIEEWLATVDENSVLTEFKKVIPILILELTNLTGNPMNDLAIPDLPEQQFELIKSYSLTRIGFDLWEATSEKGSGSETWTPQRSPAQKKVNPKSYDVS